MEEFDPSIAYCHCGKLAVAEKFEGFHDEDEIVVLVCYEHAVDAFA